MKFQWIGTGQVFARMAILSLLLLAGANAAFAGDEDMPPPADSDIPAPRTSLPVTKTPNDSAVLNEDESIPAPSLGDDALPEPSVDRGQEKARNQVNKAPEDDEIFLPTPNVNDNVYYAPVGSPAPRVTADDLDWRVMNTNRPAFSLYAGAALKSYSNTPVKASFTNGYSVAASYRVLHLGQTLFLHAYYAFSYFDVGDVGSVSNVTDQTQQLGGILELAVGRRFSLFGTLLRRQANIKAAPPKKNFNALGFPLASNAQDLSDINGVGEQPNWNLGAGFQWDFYVVPHGSIGVHVQVERSLYTLTLAMAIEPAPRKKLSLNYNDIDMAE
jgi:hypothetical protein